jgi:AcrR family transcriptional regulator
VPIWARPERGHRQPRFTREQIAATALAIADAEGFEAVSMRRIAAELKSGTMTLYHYVRTKDDLRDLLDDAIMGEVLVPDGELPRDWRGALRAIARQTRTALLRHPWSLHALQGAWFGPNALRHIDQSLAAVAGTGLDQAGKLELLALVDDYVTGHVIRLGEVRSRPELDGADVDAIMSWARAELDTGQYANLDRDAADADPTEAWREIAGQLDDDERFERGLDALLTGAAIRFGLEDR